MKKPAATRLASISSVAIAVAAFSTFGSARAADASFVANHGQYPSRVLYAAPGHPLTPWVTKDSIWFTLQGDQGPVAVSLNLTSEPVAPQLISDGAPGPAFSYYKGNQPHLWLQRIESRSRLVFSLQREESIALRADGSGIHLHSIGNNRSTRTLNVEGAALTVDATGRPQLIVAGKPVLLPVFTDGGSLELAGIDESGMPLQIAAKQIAEAQDKSGTAQREVDGSIAYASFMGSGLSDEAEATFHHGGDVFIGGHTQGFAFPATAGPIAPSRQHVVNAFVARISPSTPQEGFVTLFQGSDQLDGEEFVYAIAVNDAGETFFTGNTNSEDFPVTPGAYDTRYGGSIDAFLGKLNTNGTLAYATYFGSSEFDSAYGLGIDANDNAYIVGGTWSTDLPTTANAFAANSMGERDAFIAVVNAAGDGVTYCSYLGGSSQDQAEALAIDSSGRIHLTGWTRSTDLEQDPGRHVNRFADRAGTSPFDAFAARIDPTGATGDYAVTLGGTDEDRGDSIAIDSVGRAVVSGLTASDDFPVTALAIDSSYGGGTCSFAPCPDAFLTVLSLNGQGLLYSSYFGGSSWDASRAIAIDTDGSILMTGMTQSPDLPAVGAQADATLDGTHDAFVARFDIGSSTILLASYLGGASEDAGNALSIDNIGRVYVSGQTRSTDFPTTPNAFSSELSGDYDAFAVIFDAGPSDADGDGIADNADNCTLVFNPSQTDSNGDGFGNLCDADLSGDCAINFIDLGAMKAVFFSADQDADLNSDGSVNFLDLGIMKSAVFPATRTQRAGLVHALAVG